MRIAALYDIHGNLPALEAVLSDVRAATVDHLVIGGDVLPGPMPRETLDLLWSMEIPSTFITGNGEVAVLVEREGRDSGVPAPYRAATQWVADQLTPGDVERIAAWPKTARVDDRFFCHATPRNDHEIFIRTTPEDRLIPVFALAAAAVVVCGHTHMQFDRMVGGVRVINAGSVGMPFAEPGAYWLLMGEAIELRRTVYDLDRAADRIRGTAFPGASDFAERNVLHPPSERLMSDVFAKAELSR